MTDCCTPELIAKLGPARDHLKALEEKQAEAKKQKLADEKKGIFAENSQDVKKGDVETHKSRAELYGKIGIDSGLASDIGANVSGWYELVAVLTHGIFSLLLISSWPNCR